MHFAFFQNLKLTFQETKTANGLDSEQKIRKKVFWKMEISAERLFKSIFNEMKKAEWRKPESVKFATWNKYNNIIRNRSNSNNKNPRPLPVVGLLENDNKPAATTTTATPTAAATTIRIETSTPIMNTHSKSWEWPPLLPSVNK